MACVPFTCRVHSRARLLKFKKPNPPPPPRVNTPQYSKDSIFQRQSHETVISILNLVRQELKPQYRETVTSRLNLLRQ